MEPNQIHFKWGSWVNAETLIIFLQQNLSMSFLSVRVLGVRVSRTSICRKITHCVEVIRSAEIFKVLLRGLEFV